MEYYYLVRVIIAGICGALIGYERKNRMKEAGIRTHFVVAIGASLMMVISKYGFQDQIGWANLSLDPSRVAAQIVSGVGFLGAGMIFMHKHTVKGLTTAAGIWATAGIGMAIGSGMFLMGGGATVIIILAQIILHRKFNWLASPKTEQVTMQVVNMAGCMEGVQQMLKQKNIAVLSLQVEEHSDDLIHLVMLVRLPGAYGVEEFLSFIEQNRLIKSIEIH
ncbi:MgtC/SapB family protein [Paenibacillus doosanensis]|uniref:Mg(2+) transport ATPase n=1 Tax=Paenibacillus konkukensis TaxID=2020716 RepID=A0ABY4RMJ8_9BACL|nr:MULTISPECIES: MgtC/SapB family protein [Paenibacillus]MCS7464387.1 MgtC/SapB family protein [Paenibacillus doosanensis]UQZ83282.1 putative Mg(2+) transport ATPase [Paenibacillus konkukensis]